MIKQAFLLHPIKFVSQTLKEFSKFEGVSLYVLDNTYDFAYLIDDLKPEVLVFDPIALEKPEELESFMAELEKAEFKSLSLVSLGDKNQIQNEDLKSQVAHEISSQIEPNEFFAKLSGLLNL